MTNGKDLVTPYAWKIGADGKTPIINDDTNALTKREYFAALAMQGMYAGLYSDPNLTGWNNEDFASESAKAADALINALNKQP